MAFGKSKITSKAAKTGHKDFGKLAQVFFVGRVWGWFWKGCFGVCLLGWGCTGRSEELTANGVVRGL